MAKGGTTIWGKLLRRPMACLALLIITGTCLLSVFAYVLAVDKTPDANRMIVELGAKPVGFNKTVLLVPKSAHQLPAHSWFQWLSGYPSPYVATPINAYGFHGNQLVVYHYIDDGLQDTLIYPIRDLLLPAQQKLNAAAQLQYVRQHQLVRLRFPLGTDRFGRDIFSRLLVGSRVSIAVGLVAVALSLLLGITLGVLSGYFGGWVNALVLWLMNVLWSIPTLLLVFALTLTLGKGFWQVFIAIGLTMWVGAARIIRGQVLVIKEMEYITAATALGVGHFRKIWKHILPNIMGPIMVIAASNFAAAILTEAGLSFLGIGVQPPQPSWGLMIKEHYNFLLTNRPLLAIIPGLAIMLLVYSFHILGNALRDILDVKG